MKKIVLITTGQPSTNPRIVKEADALQGAGFDVTVLYAYFVDWATRSDSILLNTVEWKYQMAGGAPSNSRWLYLYTRLRFKFARILNRYCGNYFLIAERAQARSYDELLKAAKSMEASWYIGHNLGALAICVKAAKFNKAKAGFDFEDYHRGENDHAASFQKKRIAFLENKYISSVDYISTASPLITKKITEVFSATRGKMVTLLNCFPLSQQPAFRKKNDQDGDLQLFWFSQTIGKDRGIETIIQSLCLLNDKRIHLTLAGRCDAAMEHYLTGLAQGVQDQIHYAGIIEPPELPNFASRFDVGLALETGFSTNNNIALSNKIFTYLLAGNAVILSETAMQLSFNEENKIGESFVHNDITGLAEKIRLYQNTAKLNGQRSYNYELAKTQFNWDRESVKLVKLFEQP